MSESNPGINPDDRAFLEELGLLNLKIDPPKKSGHISRTDSELPKSDEVELWIREAYDHYVEQYNLRRRVTSTPPCTIYDAVIWSARKNNKSLTTHRMTQAANYLRRTCPGQH